MMEETDLISIIVPVYNIEQYLVRCVNSILKQTYTKIEIILVDDGSKDSSANLCDDFAKKDKRIKVIHKSNAGLGYARNSGLDIAKGKYIAFIDGDDYIEPNMIANLYNSISENCADTCIGGFKRILKNQEIEYINPFSGKCFEGESIINDLVIKMLGKNGNKSSNDYLEMSVWKVLFSNDIICQHNLRFPSERDFISEDIIFDLQYYQYAKKVICNEDVGYCYCDNEGSLTTKYNANRFYKQIILYDELKKITKELGIEKKSEHRRNTTLLSNARYSIKLENKYSGSIISKEKARKNIYIICNNPILQQSLKTYDEKYNKLGTSIIDKLMLHKRVTLLFWIMSLKNKYGI